MLFKPNPFLSKPGLLIAGQTLWQALAGLGVMLLITTKFDPSEQGWYYTFLSLASLHSVFEMGLSSAMQQVATVKYMGLSCEIKDLLRPRASELSSLLVQSIKAYSFIAIEFILIVYLFGVFIFAASTESIGMNSNWLLPLSSLVVFTGLRLLVLPFLVVAERSVRIAEVYTARLLQGVLGSLLCWAWLWFRSDLWATSMMALALIVVSLIWVGIYQMHHRKMVSLYWVAPIHFDWSKELWPLQWRVGVSWVNVFSWSQLATPMIFFLGAVLSLLGSFFAVKYSVAGVIWLMVAVQAFVVFSLPVWVWKKSLTALMVGC